MFDSSAPAAVDTAELRKARGAFFTPDAITRYITNWAVRTSEDTVLEPSAGDAAFLVQAVRRLQELANGDTAAPRVDGVEIHPAQRPYRPHPGQGGRGRPQPDR